MATVREGSTVRIHYTGKLEDGTVFDSSENSSPLEFTVGEGELVPGLEQGVIGMKQGEAKPIVVPCELGYGPHTAERVFEMDSKKLPDGFNPEIGQQLQMYRADGMPIAVTIVGISEGKVKLDSNHPLAGKTMIFDTRIVDILGEA